jgi:hypothetical protein
VASAIASAPGLPACARAPSTAVSPTAVVIRGASCLPRVSSASHGRLASSLQRRRSMSTPPDAFTTSERPFETISAAQLARASGGYSQQLFSAMQQAVSMGLTINSTTTGGHATNSMHYKGRAFDSIGTPAQMQGFYNWAASHTQAHELIHKNQFLKDGHPHAPIGGHDGHVHFSI